MAITLSIALAGASVLVATSSSANVSPAGSWPAGLARPAAASCPRGDRVVTPTSGKTDALGVDHFSYQSAPGLETNLPPSGLRASAVTPKLLADLGVRVSSETSSAGQQAVQQAVYFSAHRAAPTFCASPARPDSAKLARTPAQASGSGIRFSHLYSYNWGGYGITDAENGGTGINSASGSFTVGRDRTNTQPGAESTWVGIGGLLAADDNPASWGLIQDGVSMMYGAGYQTWFEYIGNSTTCTTAATASQCAMQFTTTAHAGPGDAVTAQVWWQTTTTACFQVTDTTHPLADIPVTCVANVPIPYDQTSAEWVNEEIVGEPTETGNLTIASYSNPGTINWTKQKFSSTLNAPGAGNSPFPAAEAVIMFGTYYPTGATNCGTGNGVLSYPTNSKTTSTGGQSSIITCSVPGYDTP